MSPFPQMIDVAVFNRQEIRRSAPVRKSVASLRLVVESALCAIVLGRHCLASMKLVAPRPKVFAIGFNKTATSSLHDLFRAAGFHSNHGERWRDSGSAFFHLLWDAYCDGVPTDFVEFDDRYPNSKFILQVREIDSWIASRLEHIERRPAERGNAISADWVVDDDAVCDWIRQRNDHHLRVLAHFADRPGDLLVINFIRDSDAAGKVMKFLGNETSVEKPHANQKPSGSSASRHQERIDRCFDRLNVPPEERSTDLICLSLMQTDNEVAGVPADTSEIREGRFGL